MGGRMSTVIKAKINKLLDKAEDPAETLEYSYEKQMELLQNVKKGIADVVTAKKRLQLQQQKLEQQVVKLDTQARQALAAGRLYLGPTAILLLFLAHSLLLWFYTWLGLLSTMMGMLL
jgi:phage shock protein A